MVCEQVYRDFLFARESSTERKNSSYCESRVKSLSIKLNVKDKFVSSFANSVEEIVWFECFFRNWFKSTSSSEMLDSRLDEGEPFIFRHSIRSLDCADSFLCAFSDRPRIIVTC